MATSVAASTLLGSSPRRPGWRKEALLRAPHRTAAPLAATRGARPRSNQACWARGGGRPAMRSRGAVVTRAAMAGTRQASAPAQREVLVTADKVAKSHDGTRNLFADLSFTVGRGDRLAVVGPNGCGKSSLLRILADKDDPTDGALTRRRGLTVGMLEQDPTLPGGCGALEAVLSMDTPQSRAAAAYEAALLAVEAGAPGAEAELSRCTTQMDAAEAVP
eukprot:jgi/Tetstr1/439939/TSEL_028346.t1